MQCVLIAQELDIIYHVLALLAGPETTTRHQGMISIKLTLSGSRSYA